MSFPHRLRINPRLMIACLVAAAALLAAWLLPASTGAAQRAPADQLVCVQPPANLAAWWPLDTDAADLVGANHGTLHNGPTFVAGRVGGAIHFGSGNDYVLVPNSPAINPGTISPSVTTIQMAAAAEVAATGNAWRQSARSITSTGIAPASTMNGIGICNDSAPQKAAATAACQGRWVSQAAIA